MLTVRVLGCGSSAGVPVLGKGWGACDPADPRNRRSRPSILLRQAATRVVIDCSPDFREQMLAAGAPPLDAVVFTHAHSDHIAGCDDLRAINWLTGRALPIWADAGTMAELRQRFAYIFANQVDEHFHAAMVAPQIIDGPFAVGGMFFVPIAQDHGTGGHSLGFRVGNFAYSTDVWRLDDAAMEQLQGLECWMVSCLTRQPGPKHSWLAQTLGWIEQLRPRRAILTGMNSTLDFAELARGLPPNVEPAYDGLEYEVAS